MQLDYGNASDCGAREILYEGLKDGNHTFEVCINGSQGVGCATHNWTVGQETFPSLFFPFFEKILVHFYFSIAIEDNQTPPY